MKAKTRYGEFSVFTEGDLISRSLLRYGEWAQCEIDILGQFISKGDAVVDAGAYIGTHTVAFSLMVGSQGSVHSFEPNRHAKALLVENILANSPKNVTVHESALGETRSRAELESGGNQNLGATQIRRLRKSAKKGIAIETLDSFQLKNVNFIKADVEGSELPLIRGAAATIASFRPTIFLECNSLQAISEFPNWLRQNEYISYGLLVDAFNPRNFNASSDNIFGPAKECGLLLIPKERSSSVSLILQRLNLPLIATIDDAALLLLHKPQYPYEVLERSASANAIGVNYPSPALGDATSRYEIKVRDLNSEMQDLRGQLDALTQSLDRDYTAKMADQETKAERKIQAMKAQVDSLTETMRSLQLEIQFQRASFHKKAQEASQAHVALERELQEDLLLAEREIQTVEHDWAAKLTGLQAEAELKLQAMRTQVDTLTLTNQSLQQEILLQKASLYKEAHEANQAHAAIESELRQNLLARQIEIAALRTDWATKMADREAETELKLQAMRMQVDALTEASRARISVESELRQNLSARQKEVEELQTDRAAKIADRQTAEEQAQALAMQVESLNRAMQSLQQETLLQKASFYKKAHETNQAHVALERELQEELLSTQRENEALDRGWTAKMAAEQAEADQNLAVMTKQIDALTQSLLEAKEEQAREEVAHSEIVLNASKVREDLEVDLRNRELSTQQEIEALERHWTAKMADQQAVAEQRLQGMTGQVDSLTQALLVAEQERQRQRISHSERTFEADRLHSEVELGLRNSLEAVRTDVKRLQLAQEELQVEKARLETNPIWRASERARKVASGILGKFVLQKKTTPPATTSSTSMEAKEPIPPHPLLENNLTDTGEGAATDDARDREMQEILQSGLFDQEYYLSSYADVAAANVDPLFHFVSFGWKEGRNPSQNFETKFYLETYPDVKESNVNPLTHYVRFGRNEDRKKTSIEMLTDISRFFDLFYQKRHVPEIHMPTIDIVIPIYNGFDFLEPLLRSILSHTSTPYRLIVVEDASPDIRVRPFLREFRQSNIDADILLIENSENMGFVGSVNKAVAEVRNHFVLLNSDTEVPPHWLERLMFPILEMDKVASTTPFTNSGTICSFPVYLKDNPLFEGLDPEVIDGYFQFVKFENSQLAIPTGIGFCMGVNKRVVDEIGMFDVIFGKGYCEENDWCSRAEKLGYRNLQVPNLFVYHKHGGSFSSEERNRLFEQNHSILLERHPSYDANIQEFIRSNSLKDLREFLIMLLSSNEADAILIFDNEIGGGAHQFRKGRISEIVDDGNAVFLISYRSNKEKIAALEFHFKTFTFSFSVKQPDDLLKLFLSLRIKAIVVNSFVSFPNVEDWIALTMKIRSAGNCKLVFLVHDYFAVCPSYTLVNDSNDYCGVPRDLNVCETCLIRSTGDFKRFEAHADIRAWRTHWESFLQNCDEIVCFGASSVEILSKAYPSIEMARFVVRPHDISGRFTQIHFESWKSAVKTIGVLGAVNMAKGSHVLRDLVEHIDSQRLPVKVILFGEIDIEIKSPSFEATGRYDIESLESIILEKNIDVFLLPSIWPETFSYTADEIMQMGFPLIVFNLGAPAERVKNYRLGKVIEPNDLYRTLFGDEGYTRAA